MSYSRFLESDVYVFMHVGGYLECCACSLSSSEELWGSFRANSTEEMVDHLAKHRNAGDYVLAGIEDRLWEDNAENFQLP